MSRYIDADALIAELQKDEERFDKEAEDCRKNSSNYTDYYMQAMSSRADGIRDAIVEVYDAPSIDIVRCKECKHRPIKEDANEADYGFNVIAPNEDERCPCLVEDGWYSWIPKDDFYCGYGEREGE